MVFGALIPYWQSNWTLWDRVGLRLFEGRSVELQLGGRRELRRQFDVAILSLGLHMPEGGLKAAMA